MKKEAPENEASYLSHGLGRSLRNPIWCFDLGSSFLLPAPPKQTYSGETAGEERESGGQRDGRRVYGFGSADNAGVAVSAQDVRGKE